MEDRALTVKIIYTIVKAYEAYEAIQNKEIASLEAKIKAQEAHMRIQEKEITSLEAQIGKTTPCETSAKPINQ